MTEVFIPFKKQFREAMLRDVDPKTATCRTKIYGGVGDTFKAFGAMFVITALEYRILETVALTLFEEEGLESPEGFRDIWRQLHPQRGYDPDQEVFLHRFQRVLS